MDSFKNYNSNVQHKYLSEEMFSGWNKFDDIDVIDIKMDAVDFNAESPSLFESALQDKKFLNNINSNNHFGEASAEAMNLSNLLERMPEIIEDEQKVLNDAELMIFFTNLLQNEESSLFSNDEKFIDENQSKKPQMQKIEHNSGRGIPFRDLTHAVEHNSSKQGGKNFNDIDIRMDAVDFNAESPSPFESALQDKNFLNININSINHFGEASAEAMDLSNLLGRMPENIEDGQKVLNDAELMIFFTNLLQNEESSLFSNDEKFINENQSKK